MTRQQIFRVTILGENPMEGEVAYFADLWRARIFVSQRPPESEFTIDSAPLGAGFKPLLVPAGGRAT